MKNRHFEDVCSINNDDFPLPRHFTRAIMSIHKYIHILSMQNAHTQCIHIYTVYIYISNIHTYIKKTISLGPSKDVTREPLNLVCNPTYPHLQRWIIHHLHPNSGEHSSRDHHVNHIYIIDINLTVTKDNF